MTIVTFYFILKWVPKLVQEMGFGNPGAVLVWASIGGFLGCMLFGSLTKYVPLRQLTIISLLLGFVGVVIFGQGAEDINHLKAVTASLGSLLTLQSLACIRCSHCISSWRSARRARVLPSAQVALAHFYHPSSQAFCLSGAGRSAP